MTLPCYRRQSGSNRHAVRFSCAGKVYDNFFREKLNFLIVACARRAMDTGKCGCNSSSTAVAAAVAVAVVAAEELLCC